MGELRRGAVVTGAGTGVGRAVARRLAADGVGVVLVGRRQNKLEEVARAIRDSGGQVEVFAGDAGDDATAAAAVEIAVDRYGRLDYAVNNAGVGGAFPSLNLGTDREVPEFFDISVEAWNRVIGTNLSGIFMGMRHQIPAMLANGGGSIVNISSVYADRAGSPDYVSSKHAVRGLTRSAAKQYASRSVRVNELQPGVISTDSPTLLVWRRQPRVVSRWDELALTPKSPPRSFSCSPMGPRTSREHTSQSTAASWLEVVLPELGPAVP
jgi:NAD(P)-dependent dehydrogenase (short-subunit alcohol dehydrogenase family)